MNRICWESASGLRFGKLVIIRKIGVCKDGHAKMECLCDCGNKTIKSCNAVLAGRSCKQCSALLQKCSAAKHGLRGSPEYSSWRSAKYRSCNKNSKDYCRYGAIGIGMSEEWQKNFMSFYQHIGPRPDGTSLDRIDNTRGYVPGNVRWATTVDQIVNRRNTTYVIVDGERVRLVEYAKRLGISTGAAHMRLKRGKLL